MSANEFAFLALGLILGVAAGAALILLFRARPASPREVRLTVTPDSIPRRATTLAASDLSASTSGGARGGPAAGTSTGEATDAVPPARDALGELDQIRTSVLAAAGLELPTRDTAARDRVREPFVLGPPLTRRDPGAVQRALVGVTVDARAGNAIAAQGTGRSDIGPLDSGRGLVGIAVGADTGDGDGSASGPALPGSAAVASGRPGAAGGGAPRGVFADTGALAPAVASSDGTRVDQPAGTRPDGGPGGDTGSADAEQDECASQRRVAEERCGTAQRLSRQADGVQATLREAQVNADQHQARATAAAERADPRAIRTAKEAAQQSFRTARGAATTRDGVESAARTWLQEINRINREAREATLAHRREQDAANALLSTIERLSVEADAARITAETAQAACIAARETLAACEEAVAMTRRGEAARRAASAPAADGTAGVATQTGPERTESDAGSPVLVAQSGTPALFRLLRGDRDVMHHIVDELSAGDVAERRRWQLQLSDFVDALLARAIESSTLEFPAHHQFWDMFTRVESRDIVAALASLGYRFDGLGGFVDGRRPSQRDLSLAVGYAGLDPMRIRRWPTEAEMPSLFAGVSVSADEYVAGVAGSLTLGDLVTVLGRRADGLADLWNAWGRVRPLLLESSTSAR